MSVQSPVASAARAALADSELLVTVDLSVRRVADPPARLRAHHGVSGGRVTAHSTAFTGVVELADIPLAGWSEELTRVATVSVAAPAAPPVPGLVVPWDLLVGTASASSRGRPDLYDALVSRAAGRCRVAGRQLGLPGCHRQLRALHATAGRLRMVGAGGRGHSGRPRLGWTSWLLFDTGWCALCPRVVDGRPMVSVEPRLPDDLVRDATAWWAAVRR